MALTNKEISDLKKNAEVINDINIVSFILRIKEKFTQYVKELKHD